MDLLIPAATVVGEARGESFKGKFAVACVIRNRANSPGWWGGPSWKSICLKPWQFSCWNDPEDGGQSFLHDLTVARIKKSYPDCLRAIKEAKEDKPDVTEGATHYVVTSWLKNPDLRPAWADKLTPTVVIGHHSFFRND